MMTSRRRHWQWRLSFRRGNWPEIGNCGRLGMFFSFGDLYGWYGEPHSILVEQFLDTLIGLTTNGKLLARSRSELQPQPNAVVSDLLDALHFDGFDDVRCELGLCQELGADLLDQFLDLD